jgi:hypothetical protein
VSETSARLKLVWTVTQRGGRSYRTRVGLAWDNPDGSLSARLDAVPVSGEILVDDWVPSTDPRSGRVGVSQSTGRSLQPSDSRVTPQAERVPPAEEEVGR